MLITSFSICLISLFIVHLQFRLNCSFLLELLLFNIVFAIPRLYSSLSFNYFLHLHEETFFDRNLVCCQIAIRLGPQGKGTRRGVVPKKLPDHCATINQVDLASYLSQNVSFLNILLYDFTHSLWGYCIALLKDNHQEIRNMFIQFINKTTTDKNLLRIFWPWINMQTRNIS